MRVSFWVQSGGVWSGGKKKGIGIWHLGGYRPAFEVCDGALQNVWHRTLCPPITLSQWQNWTGKRFWSPVFPCHCSRDKCTSDHTEIHVLWSFLVMYICGRVTVMAKEPGACTKETSLPGIVTDPDTAKCARGLEQISWQGRGFIRI